MDKWILAGLVIGGLAGCPKETDGGPASTGATASVGAGTATSTTACQEPVYCKPCDKTCTDTVGLVCAEQDCRVDVTTNDDAATCWVHCVR